MKNLKNEKKSAASICQLWVLSCVWWDLYMTFIKRDGIWVQPFISTRGSGRYQEKQLPNIKDPSQHFKAGVMCFSECLSSCLHKTNLWCLLLENSIFISFNHIILPDYCLAVGALVCWWKHKISSGKTFKDPALILVDSDLVNLDSF